MGIHPCVFSEIGIPYDMDDRHAYKTGDYTSQILAMDANHFALEGSKSNFALWTYTVMVSAVCADPVWTTRLTLATEYTRVG